MNRGGGRDLFAYLLQLLQNNTIDKVILSSEGNTNKHSFINGRKALQNTGDFYEKWGLPGGKGSQSITAEQLTTYAKDRIKKLSQEVKSVFPLPSALEIADGNHFKI